MKKSILKIFLVFLSVGSMGQTINEMEYFFDSDPGYGMATSVTITQGNTVNQIFNAPTGLPLTTGFHDLFVRVKETGGVLSISGLTGTFVVGETVTGGSSGATGTILAAFQNRIEVSTVGTFTVPEPLTGTSGATATLGTFTANWSVPESRLVYVDPTGAGTVLVEELEYFFDTDPGYGMGTKFPAFTATAVVNEMENIPTGSLSIGFHTLFVRAKAVGGVWGIPEPRLVYVDESGSGVILIDELEYFFDSDPGYGMGTKFTAFTAANMINEVESLPTGALPTGFHTLFIRAKSSSGTWGVPESRLVYVDESGSGVILIDELEYFFDSDPGYDMGTKFTAFTAAGVINQLENISTGSLSTGFHTLFLRAKSTGGTWGIPESRLVYVDPSGSVNANIVAIEYFFDTDPGVGMATAVTVNTPGFNVTEMFDILAANVPLGTHTLAIRAQNSDGVWSFIETRSVTSQLDNALNFDGTDDFVSIPDAANLDLTSTGTLTAWINPTAYPGIGECMRIVAKSWGTGGQNENSPYQLMICGTEEVQFLIGDNTVFQTLNSNSPILLNDWTHLAVSWDGSNVNLFVNGVIVATAAQTVVSFANAEDLYIGSVDGSQMMWSGDIDDVSVWDIAKTETEIQSIMTAGLMGSETNLVAYYAFDQGDAGMDNTGIISLPDETSNTNDGTLNNFALSSTASNWVDKGTGAGENIPGEPVDLFVAEISATQIDLDWTDRSFNETDFIIERSDGNNSSFSQVATVGADVTTYTDNTVTADNGYYYRIIASNIEGNSPPTAEKFGSTIPHPGNALQFDGTDDYVDVGEIGLDFTTSAFTIEFWAKRDVPGATGDWIINIGTEPSSNNESIHAGFVSGNQFSFDFKGDALVTDESFTDTDWHHWVVIHEPDMVTDDDDRKIYMDGVLLKTDDPTAGFTGTNYLKVGQAFDSEFFGGIVDEVRVWDDVRTETEINTFINTTLVGNEANLIAYYRFDQDEITDLIIPDRSTNDNPGTWIDGGGDVTNPQWVASGGMLNSNQPPVLSYIFYLDENSEAGKLIGTIVANDLQMDPVTYTILSGNTNNAFSVGASSGDITVASMEALDFETTPVFNLSVEADDGNGGNATVSITINLNDIIDENPLGIGDLNESLTIYPNPVHGSLFIEVNRGVLEGPDIQMFSVSGSQVLARSKVKSRSDRLLELDLTDLKRGVYFLKIRNQNELITKNILVR